MQQVSKIMKSLAVAPDVLSAELGGIVEDC